jgi:hypothetical protein
MFVLIPQTDTPGAHIAAARLRGQGDTVATCYGDANGEWCAAVSGGRCPLDDGVDMVVVVRPEISAERLPREEAALCGAARGIPVVIAGASGGHPYAAIATADDETSDVTAVVGTVAALPLVWHSTVATGALRTSLIASGVDPAGAWVDVHRRNGGLVVHLNLLAPGDRRSLGVAAVRVLAAMRDVDPWAKTIDVVPVVAADGIDAGRAVA